MVPGLNAQRLLPSSLGLPSVNPLHLRQRWGGLIEGHLCAYQCEFSTLLRETIWGSVHIRMVPRGRITTVRGLSLIKKPIGQESLSSLYSMVRASLDVVR